MKVLAKTASILTLPILAACVTASEPRKAYDGPELGASDLALIGCTMGASIKSIDGNDDYNGRSFKCDHYVKPGEHTVSYSLSQGSAKIGNGYAYKNDGKTIRFNTKAGHQYILFGVYDEFGDNSWKFQVVVKDANGKTIAMNAPYTVVN